MQSQNSCEDGLYLWEHSEFKPRALRSAHSLLPHSHKTCPLVLKRVKIMFTIVLGPRWTHQRPDHLFTTGLGGAGRDHDPCRHRSSPMPQASQDSPRRSTSLCSHRWLIGHVFTQMAANHTDSPVPLLSSHPPRKPPSSYLSRRTY